MGGNKRSRTFSTLREGRELGGWVVLVVGVEGVSIQHVEVWEIY